MRKHFFSSLVILMLVLMTATPAPAAPPGAQHWSAFRHNAPIGQVYFMPQDAEAPYGLFHLNPWGLLSYRLWGKEFEFTFNGFNLGRSKNYTLIYYPGEGAEIVCLGEGTTNRGGHLSIAAKLNICSLPATTDPNYFYGARLMLVPNENAACEEGNFLNPGSEQNLISYHPIRFTDTDGCPAAEVVTPPTPPAEEEDSGDGDSDLPYGGMPY